MMCMGRKNENKNSASFLALSTFSLIILECPAPFLNELLMAVKLKFFVPELFVFFYNYVNDIFPRYEKIVSFADYTVFPVTLDFFHPRVFVGTKPAASLR